MELTRLPYLAKINCHGLYKLDDGGLTTLVRGRGAGLVNIKLNNCKLITDEGVRAIAESCPSTSGVVVEWFD